jgi:hypothetical protein
MVASMNPRKPHERTFKVDHHQVSTDPKLCLDELLKASYRHQKALELVSSTELAETRRDLQNAEAALQTAVELCDYLNEDIPDMHTSSLIQEIFRRIDSKPVIEQDTSTPTEKALASYRETSKSEGSWDFISALGDAWEGELFESTEQVIEALIDLARHAYQQGRRDTFKACHVQAYDLNAVDIYNKVMRNNRFTGKPPEAKKEPVDFTTYQMIAEEIEDAFEHFGVSCHLNYGVPVKLTIIGAPNAYFEYVEKEACNIARTFYPKEWVEIPLVIEMHS